MGVTLFGKKSHRACAGHAPTPAPPAPGDPVAVRFTIQNLAEHGEFVVASIVYPDAKNYEGRKIAVYRARAADLRSAAELDPHFAETLGPLVPLARFEPTEAGWDMATRFAVLLKQEP